MRKADEVMVENGFLPEYSAEALKEAQTKDAGGPPEGKDLRELCWVSIDNASTRDFDQVQHVKDLGEGVLELLVGIADVERKVPPNSAIDRHAATNTTSIYAGVKTFHMLPEQLSTGDTSLLPNSDRWVIVAELEVSEGGHARNTGVYPALVRNKAALVYEDVAAWFEEGTPMNVPEDLRSSVATQMELQQRAFSFLQTFRRRRGALNFNKCEPATMVENGQIKCVWQHRANCARDLIEAFMIEVNIAVANFLKEKGIPAIQRIVRRPKRWDRIKEIAADFDFRLPNEPDAGALGEFMLKRRTADPRGFNQLSSTIMKLIGAGEYYVEGPGLADEPHFSLAVNDYAHSTAPNRRYPDLITQRLVKRARKIYTNEQLIEIALHCTERARAARRVERIIRKCAAAVLLMDRIGQVFDAYITGVKPNATYARLEDFPGEGRVVVGEEGLDVGDKIKVKLLSVNPDRGFIDFEKVNILQKL